MSTGSSSSIGRVRRTKSSIVYCGEKYSCVESKAEAEYECINCGTHQCSACEARLHSDFAQHSQHERRKLAQPLLDKLCQQPSCDDRNFADVKCESCAAKLCFSCDRKIHKQASKKVHRRFPISDNKKHFASSGLNDLLLIDHEDAVTAVKPKLDLDHTETEGGVPIKPLSPLSDNDDSLTFVSLPQHENFGSPLGFEKIRSPSFKQVSTVNGDCDQKTVEIDQAGRRAEVMYDTKQNPQPKHTEVEQKVVVKTMQPLDQRLQVTLPQLSTDQPREGKIEKRSVVQNTVRSHSQIPDIAATLPLSSNNAKEEGDMADIIADSLQKSQLMDEHSADDLEVRSFPLANQYEELLVKDEDDFIRQLDCEKGASAKVISIFGNTGDGKSYTLNHTFFEGRDVFKTSQLQDSCTAGVWAAYDALHGAVVMDTEGMLGVTSNHNQRMRLLLKVLAISDIIIYRTRAERLSSDMFQFLGDASKAYLKHFSVELKSASKRFQLDKAVSTLGPSVIIFHETQHTEILAKGASEPAESILRNKFQDLGLSLDAFSSLQYVGTRTRHPPTDFKSLLWAVKKQLNNNEIRCSRNPGVVFRTLKILNEKFMDEIDKAIPNMFPDQYFTCRAECLSCNKRCVLTMNHSKDGIPHETNREHQCKHQAQYDNTVYTCKACYKNGRTVLLIPKTSASTDGSWFGLASYAWSGYVLECSNCGVIYRSRQHWYGNIEPEKTVVRTEIRHVWPDGNTVLHGSHNAARRLLDGFNYVSESIAGVSAKPTKFVSAWLTDRIAPPYWVPNAEIKNCGKCKVRFDEKTRIHHCRACGKGFCGGCSSKKRLCPERGWDIEPVRVCDCCFDKTDTTELVLDTGIDASGELMPRKVGEVIGSTVGAIASIVNYPLVAIRDAARPSYWMPDEEIKDCCICKEPFGIRLKVHHCRSCGKGVCDDCSPTPRPVPSRGWDHPVRVCKICYVKEKEL